MSWKCDIVMDLAPLYQDKVASEASKRLVREHLKVCAECRAYYKRCCPAEHLQTEPPFAPPFETHGENFVLLAKRMRVRRVLLFTGFVSYVCMTMGLVLLYFFSKKDFAAIAPVFTKK